MATLENDAYKPPNAPLAREHVESVARALPVTWGRVMRVWWAYYWPVTIGGGVIGFFAGALAGIVIAMASSSVSPQIAGATLGGLLGIPLSILFLRRALQKSYREFRIQLVELER